MSTAPHRRLTEAEYLAIERAAETKSDFYDGEMFAMAGATRNHNVIVLNIGAELRALAESVKVLHESLMRPEIVQ